MFRRIKVDITRRITKKRSNMTYTIIVWGVLT